MDWATTTIPQALKRSVETWPERDFIAGEGQRWSFAVFDEKVDHLASGLAALGVRRGDHVACWLANSPWWILTWFACIRLGASLVAINTRYRTQEVEFILRQSDAKVLVAMPERWGIDYLAMIEEIAPGFAESEPGQLHCEAAPELRAVLLWGNEHAPGTRSLVELMQTPINQPALHAAEQAADTEDAVVIIYTSGTTGVPKGAMHCHRVLIHGQQIARAMHMQTGDVIMGHMPFYHVAGCVVSVIPAMQHGCTLITIGEWEPASALDLIERERVNLFGGIPTHFIDLLSIPGVEDRDTHCLKSAWIGGAPVTPNVARAVKDTLNFDALQAVYGMTETMGMTTLAGFDDPIEVTCENKGKPLGPYEVRIVDPETGETLPDGADGEIWVRGYLVMLGYYKNPKATAEAITPDGWFRTGDLAHVDEVGDIKITGRAKEMFIVGGSNAYPAEIERFLETHPRVLQAYVCGTPHPRLGEVCFAFVTSSPGEHVTSDEIIDYCRGSIADYKVPRRIEILEDFPRTSTNKVQRYLLEQEMRRRLV